VLRIAVAARNPLLSFGHLLDGELWINGRKLVPGDYNYGAPGALDESVWSETGCTCVLVTSTEDLLTMTLEDSCELTLRVPS
jgi:hypothetical protein